MERKDWDRLIPFTTGCSCMSLRSEFKGSPFSDCGTYSSRCWRLERFVFVYLLRMLRVNVLFPSGSGETLLLPEHSKVGDLKILAQHKFGKGFLKLVTVQGHVLTNPLDSLQAAGVQDGEHLTAVAGQVRVKAGIYAFAICGGNDLMLSWGRPDRGGDCSPVQNQLRNVQQIQATLWAFAAISADGSVVAWGHPGYGGDCSAVQQQLSNVQHIQATYGGAFAAILANGSVVTWGNADQGGDCSAVQHQLSNVQEIQGTGGAFAAILADASVVAWGDPESGGDCSAIQDQLRNVERIQATKVGSFAAILANASVVAWGEPSFGGDCSAVQHQLRNVQQIQATSCAFAASCLMDQWLPGGNQFLVVAALQFSISCRMCSKFRPQVAHLLRS